MKKDKSLIVTAVGLALALAVALLNYFEPYHDENVWFYVGLILLPVWAFCIAPAYVFGFYLFKKSCEGQTGEQAFRRGAFLGLMFGFELFILPILGAPVLAVMYYYNTFKIKKD